MPKKIEIITNGLNTIEINRVIDRAEMWHKAQEEGFEGSRTSFYRLLDGKVKTALGYELKQQTVIPHIRSLSSVEKISILNDFTFKPHIMDAKTETYGTVNLPVGRMQINPLNNGMFSVMILPKKGYSGDDLVTKIGFGTSKRQYVQVGKLTASEVTSLVELLR